MKGLLVNITVLVAICVGLTNGYSYKTAGSVKEDLYCPPEETGEIILYPNPENCSEFFQCAYGHLYTHVCGEGLYYCAAMEYCDYPDHCDFSNCQMDPIKQQKNLLQKPTKQHLKQIPKSEKEDLYCPPEETGEIILYPNPENCSEFFQCAYGHLYTHVCGEGLYYCAAMEYCDYPDHCDFSNCQMDPTKQQKNLLQKLTKQHLKQIPKSEKDLYCPPEETGEIILYPNPENCSEFFQCAYGHLYTHVCGEGLYYCAAMEYCDYPDHCDFSNCQMDPTKQQKNLLQKLTKQHLKQIPKSEKEDLYCPPEETGEIILYPNPENCSEFFQCAYGHLYTHVCGEGLYYCAAREYCDYPDHCDYSNCQMYPSIKDQKSLLRKLPKLKVNNFGSPKKNLFPFSHKK